MVLLIQRGKNSKRVLRVFPEVELLRWTLREQSTWIWIMIGSSELSELLVNMVMGSLVAYEAKELM